MSISGWNTALRLQGFFASGKKARANFAAIV
jgi:hypothetical protein